MQFAVQFKVNEHIFLKNPNYNLSQRMINDENNKVYGIPFINPNEKGEVDLTHFQELINQYQDRKLKIASITN